LKIAYVSGVRYGHELLATLLENNFDVSIVFSYDYSKKKFYSDYVSFNGITKKYGIKHVCVKNINDVENVRLLQKIQPDLLLVMGWSQLLREEILKIPKNCTIGSHPTELPKYRGRAPIPWSIIKNLKQSALTFFYMDAGIDNGDILEQQKFQINPEDDATSLYEKIISIGKKMLLNNLPLLEKGKAKRIKQDESKFKEYWKKRTPDDGKINWSITAKEINALIRATTHPYPGAFSFFNTKKFKIWKAKSLEEKSTEPGKILGINNEGVKVGTGKGVIVIQNISLGEGKEKSAEKLFSNKNIGEFLGSQKNYSQ